MLPTRLRHALLLPPPIAAAAVGAGEKMVNPLFQQQKRDMAMKKVRV